MDPISIVGTVASIAGLVLSVISIVRLRELKRRTAADAWQAIHTARAILSTLQAVPVSEAQVRTANGKAAELFRQLLKQAILAENEFNQTTIEKWQKAKKLDPGWQVNQAMSFLETREISARASGI